MEHLLNKTATAVKNEKTGRFSLDFGRLTALYNSGHLLFNSQRRLCATQKLRYLEEKLAEVPTERQEAYCNFVEKAVRRLLQGATAQEIWHDWQWRSVTLPAYYKQVTLEAAGN